VQILDACNYSDMTERGWKYDPPKVISDLTESVLGAMFIDSGYNYELFKIILLRIFNDLLAVVTPDLPKDPSAELLMWVTRHGCRQTRFRKCGQDESSDAPKDCFTVTVHDADILPPIRGVNISHAKCLVAEQALALLSDESGETPLSKLCSCPKTRRRKKARRRKKKAQSIDPVKEQGPEVLSELPVESTRMDEDDAAAPPTENAFVEVPTSLKDMEKAITDETVEGFATKGQLLLEKLGDLPTLPDASRDEGELSQREEEEVEKMLLD